MITLEELETWLADWDLPLGPFKTVEEVFDSMELQVRSLGPEQAAKLAEFATLLARKRHKRLNVLSIFLQRYAEQNGGVFAEALLKELKPDGPPLLLDLLGSTGARDSVPEIAKILDAENADSDLVVAWAGALGDLGGTEAKKLLLGLETRAGLDEVTAAEVAIALERIEPRSEWRWR